MDLALIYNTLIGLGCLFGFGVLLEVLLAQAANRSLLAISLTTNLMLSVGTFLKAIAGDTPWAPLILTVISVGMTDIIRRRIFPKKS